MKHKLTERNVTCCTTFTVIDVVNVTPLMSCYTGNMSNAMSPCQNQIRRLQGAKTGLGALEAEGAMSCRSRLGAMEQHPRADLGTTWPSELSWLSI